MTRHAAANRSALAAVRSSANGRVSMMVMMITLLTVCRESVHGTEIHVLRIS